MGLSTARSTIIFRMEKPYLNAHALHEALRMHAAANVDFDVDSCSMQHIHVWRADGVELLSTAVEFDAIHDKYYIEDRQLFSAATITTATSRSWLI